MDVWGIRKEAREISTTETMCKNTPGGAEWKQYWPDNEESFD